MVQRRLIWSNRAKISLYSILKFYADRNSSKTYSEKLYKKFNKEIQLLLKYPNIGIMTDLKNVRGLIIGNYIIYYEVSLKEIIIHTIWDSRQNPEALKIK
jgi:plasmid stabilization system protein ParE